MSEVDPIFRYVPRVLEMGIPVDPAIVMMMEERDRMLEDFLNGLDCGPGEAAGEPPVMRFYAEGSFLTGVNARFEFASDTSTPGAAFAYIDGSGDIGWLENGVYLVVEHVLIQGIGLANPGAGYWTYEGIATSRQATFAETMNVHAVHDGSSLLSLTNGTTVYTQLRQTSGGTLSASCALAAVKLNSSLLS